VDQAALVTGAYATNGDFTTLTLKKKTGAAPHAGPDAGRPAVVG